MPFLFLFLDQTNSFLFFWQQQKKEKKPYQIPKKPKESERECVCECMCVYEWMSRRSLILLIFVGRLFSITRSFFLRSVFTRVCCSHTTHPVVKGEVAVVVARTFFFPNTWGACMHGGGCAKFRVERESRNGHSVNRPLSWFGSFEKFFMDRFSVKRNEGHRSLSNEPKTKNNKKSKSPSRSRRGGKTERTYRNERRVLCYFYQSCGSIGTQRCSYPLCLVSFSFA